MLITEVAMKTTLAIFFLLFIATETFGQIPSQSQLIPTQFAFPTSIGYYGNAFQYDMVANELGIHLVQEDGSSIKYTLLVSGIARPPSAPEKVTLYLDAPHIQLQLI